MKFSVGHGRDGAVERLENRGVTRRDFMKFCGTVAAVMGMGPAFAPKVAEALTADNRPDVVWLHNAECTGCSESILRTVEPYIDALILDYISLNYHETIMLPPATLPRKPCGIPLKLATTSQSSKVACPPLSAVLPTKRVVMVKLVATPCSTTPLRSLKKHRLLLLTALVPLTVAFRS